MRYLVLLFDGDKIAQTRTLECDTDDDALERAAALRHLSALEVWESDRQVWRFDPSPLA